MFLNFEKFSAKTAKTNSADPDQTASEETVQTQIRLLLKKQSDQCLPCLLFWRAFCEFWH